MFLQNKGFRKTLLGKCLKSRVSEDLLTSNMVIGSNSAEISMTLVLPYLLITVKEIKFEEVSLSHRQNIRNIF